MRWALYIIGAIAALVAVAAIVGVLLPRDHVAGMSARIAATPDSVWAAITDAGGYTTWRKELKNVDVLPPTPSGPSWREHSSDGVITLVADVFEPPRRMVARIADKNLPFGGSWEYRVEPDGAAGSTVTIVERGSVYNPIFRFVSRFLMGHTSTIDRYLRALGRKFGNEPTPSLIAVGGDAHGT